MNVVVLAAHGFNCHWLGPYGNECVSTPALDALAGEAVVFDRHFADAPSAAGFRATFPPDLFGALRGAGVTLAFVDDRKGEEPDGRPWDLVVRTEPTGAPTAGDALVAAVELALRQVSGRQPWLLWIETDRLVPPWDFEAETYQHYAAATAGFTSDDESDDHPVDPGPIDEPATGAVDPQDDVLWHRLRNSFAAAVTSFDAEIDVLVDVFRELGLDQSAAWIVTSGYGCPLAEHGVVGPRGSRMHEELVHLPLLLRLPAQREGMRRVPAFTQASDLAATLPQLLETAGLSGMPGTSLLPLALATAATGRDAARSAVDGERGLRTNDWAYLPPNGDHPARLYRKPDDAWEVNDLAHRHPDECDRLAAQLNRPPTEEVAT